MDPALSSQLEKVLALADSTHEAEAVVAVRKARQILSRDGLSFTDLARAAQRRPGLNRAFSSIFSGAQAHLETQIFQLRQRLNDLQVDMQAQTVQVEFWRQRAVDLEQNFHSARSDAERWKQLARETVEKLWDLGQGQEVEFTPEQPPVAEDIPGQKTA